MKIRELPKKRWFKIVRNKYFLIGLVFVGWMLFLDSNSWLVHRELNNQIEDLEEEKSYYSTQIQKDRSILKKLSDSVELEKFARQEYFMKRENEEIFIIEYSDSLKIAKKDE